MKTIFAVTITIALTLGAIPVNPVNAQLTNAQPENRSSKKQTSDPYFSTPAQSAAEQNATWLPPEKKSTSVKSEIWKSLSRKTSEPVRRVDFSKVQVNSAVKADLLKTASAWLAPPTDGEAAQKKSRITTIDFSAPAISAPNAGQNLPHRQPEQTTAEKTTSASNAKPFSSLTPLQVSKTAPQKTVPLPSAISQKPKSLGLLTPLPNSTSANQSPKQPERLTSKPLAKPLKPVDNWKSEFQSSAQQATYQEPITGSFVPGKNVSKFRNRIQQQLAAPLTAQQNPLPQQTGSGSRTADSSTAFATHRATTVPNTVYRDVAQGDSIAHTAPGESFEPSRVVAIVGGDPIFVGDMLFEANQLIEKHMKGAPEEIKAQQRGNLIQRLLPKYVDQKMLFLSTTSTLPEGADIEDVLSQAETTFNEQALPDMMKKSGITSTAQFDANLRAQGSSIRQMRRAWAKDQIGRYLLAEQVKVNQDVTHHDLLQHYHANYDSYAHIAKCRWEKIEVKFSKAGGRFAAKDKMDDIYQRLVHGGNFQAIAKKESHGFKASKGGQHDWTNQGSLVSKKVDKAIFTLPQGRLSAIIETKDSFLVVRVIERVDAYHTPFEETQSEIKKRIVNERRDKGFKKYLEKIRESIPVEYPEG